MQFAHRQHAARLLAENLEEFRGHNPLVLALPKGGVLMGKHIADELLGDLDILLVQKIGLPAYPELLIAATTENGIVYPWPVAQALNIRKEDIHAIALNEVEKLRQKRSHYTPGRGPIAVHGRLVIVVDDGMSSTATLKAAFRHLLEQGAHRIIAALPIATKEMMKEFERDGAEVRSLHAPDLFFSINKFYGELHPVRDEEVKAALAAEPQKVVIETGRAEFLTKALVGIPEKAKGLVIFANDENSPDRIRFLQKLARCYRNAGIGTAILDLSSIYKNQKEAASPIHSIAHHLGVLTDWISRSTKGSSPLKLGYFASGLALPAALEMAVQFRQKVCAVLGLNGRLDLAAPFLPYLKVPVQFFVGGQDTTLLFTHHEYTKNIRGEKRITVLPGVTAPMEEAAAFTPISQRSIKWFQQEFGTKSAASSVNPSFAIKPGENPYSDDKHRN